MKVIKVNNTLGEQYHVVIGGEGSEYIVEGGSSDKEGAIWEYNFNKTHRLPHCNYRLDKQTVIEEMEENIEEVIIPTGYDMTDDERQKFVEERKWW